MSANVTPPAAPPLELSHLRALESEGIHLFREVAAELGERLIVAPVQDSIDRGRVVEEGGQRASRNRLQPVTLLDAIEEPGFDAAFGGHAGTRSARGPKERMPSFRDDFGQWDPKAQRPELWNLYNGRVRKGEHVRSSRFPTGLSSMCGATSPRRSSRCRRSTSRTGARSSSATECPMPPRPGWS